MSEEGAFLAKKVESGLADVIDSGTIISFAGAALLLRMVQIHARQPEGHGHNPAVQTAAAEKARLWAIKEISQILSDSKILTWADFVNFTRRR